jgi:hypothetical protein
MKILEKIYGAIEFVIEWFSDFIWWHPMLTVIGLVLAIAYVLANHASMSEAEWQSYVENNNCVVIEVSTSSAPRAWKCDDGLIYRRW